MCDVEEREAVTAMCGYVMATHSEAFWKVFVDVACAVTRNRVHFLCENDTDGCICFVIAWGPPPKVRGKNDNGNTRKRSGVSVRRVVGALVRNSQTAKKS